MRHIAYLSTAFLLLFFSCGDGKSRIDPPQTVVKNFETLFGKHADVRWESPGQDIFQASFIREGHPATAYFDGQGSWMKTETELMPSEVPSVIISTVSGAFRGAGITKALQIAEPGKEEIFRLFLKRGGQISTVDLNTSGVIMINNL